MKLPNLIFRFIALFVFTMPFLLSCEKDKGDSTQQPGVFTGYTFSVTNFNDGWNSIIKEDFVEVSNSGTTVLLHYGITLNDELRQDIINNFWNLLAADRYTVTNLYSYNYSAHLISLIITWKPM